MKKHLINRACAALAILAATWCGTARADLGPETSVTNNFTSWNNAPGGSAPFYEAQNLTGAESDAGQPSAAGGAVNTVLSETFTITNGAGLVLTNGNTNYLLTGIGLLISGNGTTPLTIHLFDVTSNLTSGNGSIYNGSGAAYNFTANGDLLGGGSGLSWVNNTNSGGEQQVFLPLTQGPDSYDQVVLAGGHSYAFEIWDPTSAGGEINWFKDSVGEPGGQGMGSHDSSLAVSRATLTTLGLVGGAPRTFGLALYGSITSSNGSVNTVTNLAGVSNYIVDAFNSYGYGPTNPYVGTNDYSTGGIINLWTNWFGSAWVTNTWDSTMDAGGNTPLSGSLRILAVFTNGGQFLAGDYSTGITPPLDALTLGISSFQCDVLFSNGSATTVNGSVTNYGHLQFGLSEAPGFTVFDAFGSVEVPVGTTNWTHVDIALDPDLDANLSSIDNVIIKIDGNWYPSTALDGTTVLWVDNIKFVGATAPPGAPPPPKLSGLKTVPELRIFAGSTVNTYDREELDTYLWGDESWVNRSFPVTYSFSLLDFPVAPGMQCHVFLVPVNYLPAGNAPTNNEYVDYQASNDLWLDIVGGGLNTNTGTAGYTVSLLWKTNLPNANAATEALSSGTSYTNATNQSPVGTWSLIFSNNTAGALVPPGAAPQPFNINDPNVATDFGPTVEALIGLQPNSTAGEGTYIDYGMVKITGTAGPINENFVTDPALGYTSITSSGYWDITDSVNTPGVVLVNPTNSPLWLVWTLPDVNFGLEAIASLPTNAPPGDVGGWVLPSRFNGYNITPITAERAGGTNWTLVPASCLPSADPSEYPGATNAYFNLTTNVPAN